jgi:hypothetical protein
LLRAPAGPAEGSVGLSVVLKDAAIVTGVVSGWEEAFAPGGSDAPRLHQLCTQHVQSRGYEMRNESVTELNIVGRMRLHSSLIEAINALLRSAFLKGKCQIGGSEHFSHPWRLYAITARLNSVRAPDNPRSRRRGRPQMRCLIVAKGCSTMDLRSRMAAAVARSFIRVRASSNMCLDTRPEQDAVQRCFRGQPE